MFCKIFQTFSTQNLAGQLHILQSLTNVVKNFFPTFSTDTIRIYSTAGRNAPRRTCPPPDSGRGRGPLAASYRGAMTQMTMGGAGVKDAEGGRTEFRQRLLPDRLGSSATPEVVFVDGMPIITGSATPGAVFVDGMATKPSEALDLELLDFVAVVLAGEEDGDVEDFAAGLEGAEGVLHVGAAGRVADVEAAGSVGIEERFHDLLRLGAAGVAFLGENCYLQIVGKPCRDGVGMALREVFAYGYEYVVVGGFGLRRGSCKAVRNRRCLAKRKHCPQKQEGSRETDSQNVHTA